MKKPTLICIIGPDGVGKTTQANMLLKIFNETGKKYEYKWHRFFHFFSLPVLAIAKLLGYSKTERYGRYKIGYHQFYKSRLISVLYTYLLFLDTMISTLLKMYLPVKLFKKCFIADRFVYDTLVDLMISTKNYTLYKDRIGKFFLRMVPKWSTTILLIANENELKKRRIDVLYDKTLSQKIFLYKALAEECNIPLVEADAGKEKVLKEILYIVKHESKADTPLK